ncbi:hypothetical protein LCGC14_1656890, partial [marine sediment metagenome]
MSKNLILVFEFVSGGGFGKKNITSSLFCEGFGMLKTIISDFKMLNFEISTLLDYRVFFLSRFLQADIVKKVNANDNYLKLFKKLVKECKYAFIIAPESYFGWENGANALSSSVGAFIKTLNREFQIPIKLIYSVNPEQIINEISIWDKIEEVAY